MKAAISENLISAFGIIISLALIFLIGSIVFGDTSTQATEASYRKIARDIAGTIDRLGSEAGSAVLQYDLPAGQNVDIEIRHKSIEVSSGAARQGMAFSAIRNFPDQRFEKPRSLCFVKSRFDRSIMAKAGACGCRLADSVCDAECIVKNVCDAGCRKNEKDSICNPFCAVQGDGICDQDCYRNGPDTVWDPDCKNAAGAGDGICDPDSALDDGYCDPDCVGKEGYCDPDCPDFSLKCDPRCKTDPAACAPKKGEGETCTGNGECQGGLLCSSGKCCPIGTEWNGTACGKPQGPVTPPAEPTFKILVVPLNWGGTKTEFDSTTKIIHSYYLERLPLAACPQQYKGLSPDFTTNYGSSWKNGYCDASSLEASTGCYDPGGVLNRIFRCGREYTQSTGESWDYVVGIDDSDISISPSCAALRGVGGWSDGYGQTPSVIVESRDAVGAAGITAHELGHEFAFGEQYCDCTGIKDPDTGLDAGKEICGTSHPVNPLRASLGCGGKGTSCGRPEKGSPPQCPGGVFTWGNRDRLSSGVYTSPNVQDGKRSIMSNLVLDPSTRPLSGHYSEDEWRILVADPRLKCKA